MVTEASSTVIDLVFTSAKETLSGSGVINLGISDRSLTYGVRKCGLSKSKSCIKEIGDFKHFVDEKFLEDLSQMRLNEIQQSDDSQRMLECMEIVFYRDFK